MCRNELPIWRSARGAERSESTRRTKRYSQRNTSAIRDISQRKQNEERIRELNANLEERVLQRTEALLRSNEELQQIDDILSG